MLCENHYQIQNKERFSFFFILVIVVVFRWTASFSPQIGSIPEFQLESILRSQENFPIKMDAQEIVLSVARWFLLPSFLIDTTVGSDTVSLWWYVGGNYHSEE